MPDPSTMFFTQAVMSEIGLCKADIRNEKGRRMAKKEETFQETKRYI